MPEIKDKLKNQDEIHAKTKFTMVIPEVEQKLAQLKRDGAVDTIILAGVESHVCIVATCQDLVQKGYTVGNKNFKDPRTALFVPIISL